MTCVHHWVIESPDGPTSRGRCRKCKARRDFPNSAEFKAWTANGAAARGRRAGAATNATRLAKNAKAVASERLAKNAKAVASERHAKNAKAVASERHAGVDLFDDVTPETF